jgi:hypothetical protein
MRNPDITDSDLISESLQSPEVFGIIFDRHFEVIYRYLERRLGRDDADT